MKVSDYIVSYLIEKEITDVFGYPGGMVTHLLDSFSKYKEDISAHINYHEQGAAFAACGYAQISLKPGFAYATSGPGVANLLSGICNAYYDSAPAVFLTGQVNTYEGKGDSLVRQKGFQEMDVCAMVASVTKYTAYVEDAKDIRYHLDRAFYNAVSGRPGPAVLDVPMDVQRQDVVPEELERYIPEDPGYQQVNTVVELIHKALAEAKRPCILVGAGMQNCGMGEYFRKWIENVKLPVVSSMLAVDILPESEYYYGFVGAYGSRQANFIISKCDLIISFGSRMDIRQTGVNKDNFATNARLIRVDIDENEFTNKIKENEVDVFIELKKLMPALLDRHNEMPAMDFSSWLSVCDEIKSKLAGYDKEYSNLVIEEISKNIDKDSLVTTDVGQNQVWVAQSFIARGQRILFSGGHGAMGYSLPAAIGAYYAGKKKVYAFTGDGGFQMNTQELQFLYRENLPIKVILLNNSSLGMIRHFQEMYFESNFVQTKAEAGYTNPDFGAIAAAYKIPYAKVSCIEDVADIKPFLEDDKPALIEVDLGDTTYVFPKLSMGKKPHEQDPELDEELGKYISNL